MLSEVGIGVKELTEAAMAILALVVHAWAVIKYLITRMDKQSKELHERVDRYREDMVTRADHHRDTANLQEEIRGIRKDLNAMNTNISNLIIQLTRDGSGKR